MRRSRTGRRSGSPIPRRWKRRDAQSFRLVSDFSGRSPCRKTKRALAGTGCNLELEPSKQSSFEIQKAPKVSVMGWSGGDHDSHFNARLDADAGDGWFSRVLTTLYNTYVYICLYMVLVLVNLSIAHLRLTSCSLTPENFHWAEKTTCSELICSHHSAQAQARLLPNLYSHLSQD